MPNREKKNWSYPSKAQKVKALPKEKTMIQNLTFDRRW